MAEEAVELDQGLGRTMKDLVSGAAGGVAQVLIGENQSRVPIAVEVSLLRYCAILMAVSCVLDEENDSTCIIYSGL